MKENSTVILSNYAYDQLIEMIFTKRIRSGDKINEKYLQKELGTSRTPIREAIRRLANEGLINIYPNRFSEIITFSEESIKDLGIVRMSIETLATQLAVIHGSNKDFFDLKRIAEDSAAANSRNDIYSRIKYDCDFHLKLSEISGNIFLINIHNTIYLKVRLLQTLLIHSSSYFSNSISEHFRIIDALIQRNLDDAIKAIQDHITDFYHLDLQSFRTMQYASSISGDI